MKRSLSILFIILTFYSTNYFAQNNRKANLPSVIQDSVQANPPIVLLSKNYKDSVILRWSPGNALLWKFANEYGYILKRIKINSSGDPITSSLVQLNNKPIVPLSLNEMKTKFGKTDTLAAVAAQLLYGKHFFANLKKGINLNQIMMQNTEEENRFGYAVTMADFAPQISFALGLRWVDKNIEKGASYLYMIYTLVPQKLMESDTAYTMVNTSEPLFIPSMPQVRVEELDRAVKFHWSGLESRRYFSAYNIERSSDGGKIYKRVNKFPIIQTAAPKKLYLPDSMVVIDSLPQNYFRYYYKITGITPFGDLGKSSPALHVMGVDKTPPSAPTKVNVENIKKNHVKITWQKKIKEKDFTGYMIGRGTNITGPFMPLFLKPLSKYDTQYIDTTAAQHGKNFYVVSALDTAGNAGVSFPAYVIMKDTTPPAKPTGLTGTIDSNGVVTLKWNMGKEEDLLGYLVYFANSKEHVFTPLTKGFLVDTTFIDTISLNTLTRKIYYTVIAFDKNQNASPFSDTLALTKPDTIHPVKPVIGSYFVTDSSVTFSWTPSSSEDADSQFVFRKEGNSNWELLAKFDNKTDTYTDTAVKRLKHYLYSVEAMDYSKLKSGKSFPLNIRVYDSGVRKLINAFSALLSEDKKSVHLKWQQRSESNSKVIIYRNFNNSGLQMYDSTPGKNNSYDDINVQKGKYQYAIKVVMNNGTESPLSKLVTVDISK